MITQEIILSCCVPIAPQIRTIIVSVIGSVHINKKVWVAVPVARPTRSGVSHCPSLKVEQRRSPHENMYLHPRMTPYF